MCCLLVFVALDFAVANELFEKNDISKETK